MPKILDLKDKRFGRLVAVERTDQKEKGYFLWRCLCDCGGEVLVSSKRLARGTVADCGCVPPKNARRGSIAEDLTGRQFGEWTVLRRAPNRRGRVHWLCRCSCGTQREISAKALKSGRTTMCKSSRHTTLRSHCDLAGRRFGKLMALHMTDGRSPKGSVMWCCLCDCGRMADVSADDLVWGNTKSCGCLKQQVQANISNTLHHVDGTCVELLERRKYRSDNTSGFRGVICLKNGRFRASIGFKGQRYYIGTYTTMEAAVQARMEAEETIHNGFLKAYHKWQSLAEGSPEWARENPLIYEVEKVNGDFRVISSMAPDLPGQRAVGSK
ncbi:MAG: transcriptional regulator [Eubacterium sp.]|nr:transcriptional regulator [Eubacterium sp.]